MPPLSKDEAQRLLKSLHGPAAVVVYSAWDKWERHVVPLFPLPTVRFRRNAVYDLIVQFARIHLQGITGIAFIETKRGRILIFVSSKTRPILLRFKKVDSDLHTSNYPTQESLKYDHNLLLPGIPCGARLTIGYAVNQFETELRGVYVICATGRKVHWSYELARPAVPSAEIIPFPKEPSGPSRDIGTAAGDLVQSASRIRPKKSNVVPLPKRKKSGKDDTSN